MVNFEDLKGLPQDDQDKILAGYMRLKNGIYPYDYSNNPLIKAIIKACYENDGLELENSNENLDECGVYGIWIEDKIVYIGKTKSKSGFKNRFAYHNSMIKTGGEDLYIGLREAIRSGQHYYMRPIISLSGEEFSERDIECMEFALISFLKPKFNKEGINKKYRFC